jgi:predicted amidohydrolase
MFVVFSDGADIAGQPKPAGAAMIVDPFGRTLADMSSGETTGGLVYAELDTRLIGVSPGREWLGARRSDLYGALSRSALNATDFDAQRVSAKGAVAVSFAQVRRNRVIG